MKALLFLTLTALAAATPLTAQSAPASLSGESDGEFRDLGIVELVDATDALLDPDPAPRTRTSSREAPDASLCSPESLLFCEQEPLAPGEPFGPTIVQAATDFSDPVTSTTLVADPTSSKSPEGRLVACSESGTGDGSDVHALQPVLAGATPVPADQVPEPSAILLVVGAAAWILLRRKY